MGREFKHNIMYEIKERWSPRSISEKEIIKNDIQAILEAARFAPSCFNEQPWRFIVACEKEELQNMRDILVDSNRVWADKAPVLITIISKRTFSQNGKDNFWHAFDTGTAWGYLSLEAQRRGLVTHAMGGFKSDKARVKLNIPEEYDIMAVVAVGVLEDKRDLPKKLMEREQPGERNDMKDIVFNGKFGI